MDFTSYYRPPMYQTFAIVSNLHTLVHYCVRYMLIILSIIHCLFGRPIFRLVKLASPIKVLLEVLTLGWLQTYKMNKFTILLSLSNPHHKKRQVEWLFCRSCENFVWEGKRLNLTEKENGEIVVLLFLDENWNHIIILHIMRFYKVQSLIMFIPYLRYDTIHKVVRIKIILLIIWVRMLKNHLIIHIFLYIFTKYTFLFIVY